MTLINDNNWQFQLKHCIKNIDALKKALPLSDDMVAEISKTAGEFPFLITPYYLSLAQSNDYSDPILRQCLPHPDELAQSSIADPLAEDKTSPVTGLVHRYPDRCLLILTNNCATLCRHCMRKRRWGDGGLTLTKKHIERITDYLNQHPEVHEVLLSGGDPLLVNEDFLDLVLERLSSVESIDYVRIGSRLLTVLPQRFTRDFCQILSRHKPVWLACHFNHPNELTPKVATAVSNLMQAGIPLINQTVLLKGVNDNADTITELCRKLLKFRIKPYYLFHGDPVAGTTHFRTGIQCGLDIMRQLAGNLSGLAMPHFAIDLPDAGGKVRLLPDYYKGSTKDNTPRFESYDGRIIEYKETFF